MAVMAIAIDSRRGTDNNQPKGAAEEILAGNVDIF
jgi:hypothetical protein